MKKLLFLLSFGAIFTASGMNQTAQNIITIDFRHMSSANYKKVPFVTLRNIINNHTDRMEWPGVLEKIVYMEPLDGFSITIRTDNNGNATLNIPANTPVGLNTNIVGKLQVPINLTLYDFKRDEWLKLIDEENKFNMHPPTVTNNRQEQNSSYHNSAPKKESPWQKYLPKNKIAMGLGIAGLGTLLVGGIAVYYKWFRGK